MAIELFCPSVDSTMDEARRLVAGSRFWADRPLFVVRAGHQYGGRGRRGARWVDRPGEAILATIVRRHKKGQPRYDTTIPLRVGLGVCRGTEAVLAKLAPGGAHPQIKWPNDVLVGERKLVGILVESDSARSYIGVGFNLSPILGSVKGLAPISLAEVIEDATGRPESPSAVAVWPVVLEAIVAALEVVEWRIPVLERLAWRERVVTVEGVRGRITGIDRDGALLLRDATGREHVVVSGTLRVD